ncbi:competence protein ComK [Sporosarcina sp. UB5]|uniref:competence protein ComK n=1 Tax=Sporosarcina sp. UB5 TaxID=3047463 RepID=UPI003D7A7D50
MTEFVTRYYVSFDTLMLQPFEEGNKTFTKVIERNRTLTVLQKPIHIVTGSCTFYGSSYQNVMNTSRVLFGENKQKAPILTANAFGIPLILIPTLSPLSDQNVWISYHAIDFFETDGLGTSVTLENGEKYKLGISIPTMYRQFSLARLLERDFLKQQKAFDRSPFLFSPNGPPADYPIL